MLEHLELLSVGGAAVIVTVLFLIVIERRNWRYVSAWMVLLTAGAWLWLVGLFGQHLLTGTPGEWAMTVRWLTRVVMVTGVLLMPSALLHGSLRLWRTGVELNPPRRWPYVSAYVPMLVVIPCSISLRSRAPDSDFLVLVQPYVVPYLIGLTSISAFAAVQFVRLRRTVSQPGVRQFLAGMASTLVAMTGLIVFAVLIAIPAWPDAARWWRLIVSLTPVVPAIVFGYFVGRFQLLPLILERTFAYAGIVVGLLLFHRVAVQGFTDELSSRLGVDLAIVQGMLAIALVLAYRPLRQRAGEALRYLLGHRVHETRDRIRSLAVTLTERAGRPEDELLAWFVRAVRDALRVEFVSGWLMQGEVTISPTGGEGSTVVSSRAQGATGSLLPVRATTAIARADKPPVAPDRVTFDDMTALHAAFVSANQRVCTRLDAPTDEAVAALDRADAEIAIRLAHGSVAGLLILGRKPWHEPLSEEDCNAVILLAEQFASTLHNSRLHAERLAAERRALQHEKLSTLGLLAGSLAHEIKNPLSSIKTIVTVMSEQNGSAGPHAEEFRLVLGEIERLTTTTSQLLDIVRTPRTDSAPVDVSAVIEQTLRLLTLLARQRNVKLESRLAACLPSLAAGEASLREIAINLLTNSIDAAGSGGCVTITSRQDDGRIVLEVHDSGPGIPPEVQDRIFEPLVTTKESGTGLGLYVVGRRVQELGGEIHCRSVPGEGTRFTVIFPLSPPGERGQG
jgi:signal transduction histidine kinase